jgi:hypothetical protein
MSASVVGNDCHYYYEMVISNETKKKNNFFFGGWRWICDFDPPSFLLLPHY